MTKKTHKDPYKLKFNYTTILTRVLFYPENEMAVHFTELMKRKAITKREIDKLRTMGFEVEIGVRKIELPQGY